MANLQALRRAFRDRQCPGCGRAVEIGEGNFEGAADGRLAYQCPRCRQQSIVLLRWDEQAQHAVAVWAETN